MTPQTTPGDGPLSMPSDSPSSRSKAINNSLIFKYRLGQLQQAQVNDKATVEVGQAKDKLFEASGMASAAAASAGVEGPSVEALLAGYAAATGMDISNINANRDAEVAQGQQEMKGFKMDANARFMGNASRMNALRFQEPEDPTTRILGRFFNAAFQTGTAYANYSVPTPNPDGTSTRRLGRLGL